MAHRGGVYAKLARFGRTRQRQAAERLASRARRGLPVPPPGMPMAGMPMAGADIPQWGGGGQTPSGAPTFAEQVTTDLGYLPNNPNDLNAPPSLSDFGDASGGPAGGGGGGVGGEGGSGTTGDGQSPHKGGYVKGNKRLTGGLTAKQRKAAVPALLQKGEFVVNAKATAKHREMLEHINRSGLQPRDRMSQGQRAMRDRSTRGSPAMSMAELCQGYRKL